MSYFLGGVENCDEERGYVFLKVLYSRPGSLSGPALLLSWILEMTFRTSSRVMSPSQLAREVSGRLRLRSCLSRVAADFLSDGLSS